MRARLDDERVISGSFDKTLRLWDVDSGDTIRIFEGHTNRVTSVAFSPDGKTLASGSYDKNIILWEVGREYHPLGPPLIGHTNDVNSLAWRPDGQMIVSGSWDNTMILWHLDFAPWHERACRVANRELTETEWSEFIGSTFPYQTLCSG